MTSTSEETPLSYEYFHPKTKWIMDDSHATLELYLPGFKKEQLKVTTNDAGFLYVSGERPEGSDKLLRFRKEIKISSRNPRPVEVKERRWRCFNVKTKISSKTLDPNEIHVKFSSNTLSITMPRHTLPPELVSEAASSSEAAADAALNEVKKAAEAAKAAAETAAEAAAATQSRWNRGAKQDSTEINVVVSPTPTRPCLIRTKSGRITVVRVARGLVAVVVLFLVAYAASKYYLRGLLES